MQGPVRFVPRRQARIDDHVRVGGSAPTTGVRDYLPERFVIEKNDSLLVPAECRDYNLVPMERDTILLETTNSRVEPDRYIDPDVPASLPGQS